MGGRGGSTELLCDNAQIIFLFYAPQWGNHTDLLLHFLFSSFRNYTFFLPIFFFFFRHKEINNSPISKRGPVQRKFGNHCKKRFANVLILFVCFMFVCHIPMNRDQINTGRNSTAVLQSKSNVGHAPSTPTMSATA